MGDGARRRNRFKLEPEKKGARDTKLWTLNVQIMPGRLGSDQFQDREKSLRRLELGLLCPEDLNSFYLVRALGPEKTGPWIWYLSPKQSS